jgi:FkbM family methyltransferase
MRLTAQVMSLWETQLKPALVAARRLARKAPLVRYAHARWLALRDGENGKRLFDDHDAYFRALHEKRDGTIVLRTQDGLGIVVRQNVCDARIVREIFVDKPYVKHLALPPAPTVIDIGGYIGDFSLYAVKRLGAKRVVVFEPTAENFKVLIRNVELNGYGDRITAVNKAVSDGNEIVLNVQTLGQEEMHVSAYWYKDAERRTLPAVTLADAFTSYGLDEVDLLKVDCEGGEYDLFAAVPDELFSRIGNIVFEYHTIEGYKPRLDELLTKLQRVGYELRIDGDIVSALRADWNARRRA